MLPAGTFDGKVSLITGGGTGIGFAMASEIARLGGKVILVSRKAEHLEPAAESIRKARRRSRRWRTGSSPSISTSTAS